MIEKLDLKSMSVPDGKKAQLRELFPEVFTEGDKIDFDKLRLTLGDSIDSNDERFGLHWAGKKDCFRIIQEPSIGTLKPAREESVNWENTENLFIEGDNLEVLKLLQKSYYGAVKMIYIDPPYNTGKEFIYPDKYQENINTYLAYTGQINDDGYKFSTNTELEGRYHSNWLNMMYPRLFLARNLLREDGVIFISIDDNEADNLKKLCSEIFGEENFISQLVWEKKKKGAFLSGKITTVKEYIIVYTKSAEAFQGLIGEINTNIETYPCINAPNNRELRTIPAGIKSKYREKNHFLEKGSIISASTMDLVLHSDLVIENGKLKEELIIEGNWRYTQDSMTEYANNEELYITQDLYLRRIVKEPRYKTLKDLLPRVGSNSALDYKQIDLNNLFKGGWGSNEDGNAELLELLGEQNILDYPKPSKLLAKLIASCRDTEAIVLDFFAGSATLAHSVFINSVLDGSFQKFILVQLPEKLDPSKKEQKIGYDFCVKNSFPTNIAEIGKERIRKTIRKFLEEKKALKTELQSKETALFELEAQKAKTPKLFENSKSGDLSDLETSIQELKTKITNIENTDLGFKVFKLDKSNFKIWDGAVENNIPQQIEMAIDHINPNSSELDLLYEILLKAGFELTVPIEELTLADKKVYSIKDNSLLICLEKELNEDVVRAIAAKEPTRFVCLDAGFKNNDQLKTNAVQIMKSHNVHDFKTV